MPPASANVPSLVRICDPDHNQHVLPIAGCPLIAALTPKPAQWSAVFDDPAPKDQKINRCRRILPLVRPLRTKKKGKRELT